MQKYSLQPVADVLKSVGWLVPPYVSVGLLETVAHKRQGSNTTAHAPKTHWNITELDALDTLTTMSLIHRRLDNSIRTHVP